jgi:hypothetical protein
LSFDGSLDFKGSFLEGDALFGSSFLVVFGIEFGIEPIAEGIPIFADTISVSM